MKQRTSFPKLAAWAIALATLLAVLPASPRTEECTTAVVSGAATPDGRPLLWKNRDTEEPDNKVVLVTDGPLAAVAVASVGTSSSVWMGVNVAGFAIENSNSEDLEGTSGSGNGTFMRQALATCSTAADFEALLIQTNATGRATQANYGVIDAAGGAAMFEVGNHTFRKFDATDPADAPNGFIVRTNFAFTGDGSGTGQVRYARAVDLLTAAALSGTLTHVFLLRSAARDLKNDIVDPYPLPYEGGQDGRPAGFIRTVFSINRTTTRSATVFRGVLPSEDPRLTTMWTILGEPVCSIALPVWPLAGAVPPELGGPAASPYGSPVCDEAIVKKELCYHLATSPEYIDTAVLDDGLGGGLFGFTQGIEDHALALAEAALQAWRDVPPPAMDVHYFQDLLTSEHFSCYLASSPPNDTLSAPVALAARTDVNRSLLLREYVHTLTWHPPDIGLPIAYRIYDVSDGRRTLLAEVPAETRVFSRRGVDRAKRTIYAVLAVDATGAEGSPACVLRGQAAEAPVRASVRSTRVQSIAIGVAAALRRLGPVRGF
jgi:hypothetical protein